MNGISMLESNADWFRLSYFSSSYLTATITDSDSNVLCKYKIDYYEVDSSNLLTFGAIDESYARKTEVEEDLDSLKSELIDLFYPVGISIKLANGVSVPSTGTWELVGIYGQYSYTSSDIVHNVDFLGTSIIDSVKTNDAIDSGSSISWFYTSLLGSDNYTITTTFGSYQNDLSKSQYNLNATIPYTDSTTYFIFNTDTQVSFEGLGKGIACQVRVSITDLSKVSVSDDGLSFEYKRSA